MHIEYMNEQIECMKKELAELHYKQHVSSI